MALSTLTTLTRKAFSSPRLPTTTTFKPSSSSSSVSCSSLNPTPTPKKRPLLDLGIGLLAASVVGLAPLEASATRVEYYATVAEPSCEFKFAPSGLGYCDVALGSGPEAPFAQLINIHYTARFADGLVFDSSYKRARPLTMRIGVGKVLCAGKQSSSRQVIKGLDQGIYGGEGVPPMLVGGKRMLQIPPKLAYGPEPAGCFSGDCNIPANATLVYNINFVDIYKGNRK
ncbi:hypothetical protein RJ639_000947 [Escallonia herrerae]|uniref:peptidylprolyl isomerase n=1 Tax=Escallonia herrerae TaxID=1293975 RepID=A0AA88XIE7_9ASTE|nr:hypothetical protein RJ639_000947 [Escallonia herrerae]